MSLGRRRNLDRSGTAVDVCGTAWSALLRMLLALVVVACMRPDVSYGGTYVMRSCNVPDQKSAASSPWTWMNTTSDVFANDDCATGGGFGLNAGPMPRGKGAAVVIVPPTDITIRRVKLWLVARLGGSGSYLYVATASGGPASGAASEDIFGPPGGETLRVPWVSKALAGDTNIYHVILACSGNTWDGCQPSSPTPLDIRGAEVTLNEDVPPTGKVTGGALLGGGSQSGARAVTYAAGDAESGVAQVSVSLGTKVVATQRFDVECPHTNYSVCPNERSGALPVDTTKVPNGNYPLVLEIVDAAGNRRVIPPEHAVEVANAELSPSTEPVSVRSTGEARLTAAFVGRRGSTTTVPFNSRVKIRGRLFTRSGKPIKGARVEITEVPVEGGRARSRIARTRSNGRFTYSTRTKGPSRRVDMRYRIGATSGRVAAFKRLRIKVLAAATLRVSLRGTRVRYSGRLTALPAPRRGKLIYMEGRAVGGAWTRFAVRRTTRSGRFEGRYRLRVRRPGVRLQFRLRIPREMGYPYYARVGPTVTRTVR